MAVSRILTKSASVFEPDLDSCFQNPTNKLTNTAENFPVQLLPNALCGRRSKAGCALRGPRGNEAALQRHVRLRPAPALEGGGERGEE